MRIVREVLLLLALITVVAGVVFGTWHFWPKHRRQSTSATSDSTILLHAEERLRSLVRREVVVDALLDREVTKGMQTIQERVMSGASPMPYPIEVYVIDSPTVNAVCLPGGIIVVYSGLIRRLESAEEMAAVLSHEIAHAANHDSMHALERELGVAAILTLAGGQSDALTMRLLRRLINSGFSRQQEQTADKEGVRMLASADIDPASLAESLRHIRADDASDPSVFQYISTHPDVEARIKTAEAVSAAWKGKARPIDMDWKKYRAQFRMLR